MSETTTTSLPRPVHKVFKRTHDPLWQMQLSVVVIIGLQLLTSSTFLPVHKLWLIAVEVVMLLALVVVTTEGYGKVSRTRHSLAILLIAVIAAINIFSLLLLINALFVGHSDGISGRALLLNGLVIYITNVFMFALWYWELDGNGPDRRTTGQVRRDFLFPQMIHEKFGPGWLPGFADYMYLSTTNVTNFASADTQPLTHRAKLLMMIQSLVAVVTVVLVLARAINILQ